MSSQNNIWDYTKYTQTSPQQNIWKGTYNNYKKAQWTKPTIQKDPFHKNTWQPPQEKIYEEEFKNIETAIKQYKNKTNMNNLKKQISNISNIEFQQLQKQLKQLKKTRSKSRQKRERKTRKNRK